MKTGLNTRILKRPSEIEIYATLAEGRLHGATKWVMNTEHICYMAPGTADIEYPPAEWLTPSLAFSDVGQNPRAPIHETCDSDHIAHYARMAYSLGYTEVWWRPLLEPMWDGGRGGWRGYMVLPSAYRRKWVADVEKRVFAPYLPVVKELNLGICFASEMWYISHVWGAAPWIEMANWLRAKVRLGPYWPLSYGANWGPPGAGAEWRLLEPLAPYLDIYGIDWYQPWQSPADQRLGLPALVQDLAAFKARIQRPLELQEVGWPNTHYAAELPYGGPPAPFTTEVSEQMWRGARELFEPVIDSWVAWEGGKVNGVSSTHDILGTVIAPIALGGAEL